MAGFDPKEVKRSKIEIDLEEDDDLDIDTDIDEVDEPSTSDSKTVSDKPKQKKTTISRDVNKKNSKEQSNKMIAIAGSIAVISIITIIFIVGKFSKDKNEVTVDETPVVNSTVTDEKKKPGVPNLNGIGAEQNDDKLYDPSLVTKDLNGNSLEPDFKIVNSEDVTDFISYVKYRAPMGNGLEFYWLEATYKGSSYKVQVPYSIYSKLDREGITVVDMEMLTLEGGTKMITYMKVRKDAKSLLEKDR